MSPKSRSQAKLAPAACAWPGDGDYLFRLPLQPSYFLSLLVIVAHFILATIVMLSSISWLWVLFCLAILLCSGLWWLLKHGSMSGFELCCCTLAAAPSAPQLFGQAVSPQAVCYELQGREQPMLAPAPLHLEWWHHELMIWRAEISTKQLAAQLLASADRRGLAYLCGQVWALLPSFQLSWRLILWRQAHIARAWRLLCQRVLLARA